MAAYDRQPFASGSPVIDSLFAREFAQSQAQRQAEAQAMANATARAQIAAQSELARSQMSQSQAQQDYNNLFRTSELRSRESAERDRNALLTRQLEIDKAYKEGILKRPDARTQSELEEANALADAIASQLNAAYDTRVKTRKAAIEVERQRALSGFTPFTLDSTINTKYEQMLKDAEDQEFQTVLEIGTKNNPGQFKVDPATKRFVPVRFGVPGAAVAPASNPAALGVPPIAAAPVITSGTTSLGGLTLGPNTFAPQTLTESASPADLFGNRTPVTPAPPMPSVRRTFRNATVLLTPEDNALLDTVPPEQRPVMVNQWLNTGRARLAPAAIPYTEPDYNRF